jgi:serpin B
MNRKGFAPIVLILTIVVIVAVGVGVWFVYLNQQKSQTLPPVAGVTSSTVQSSSSQATTKNSSSSNVQPPVAQVSRAGNVSDANNQFAVDLYSRYASEKDSGENIFFSPFSISSAMAMVYEGAKGQTAQEIENVFHFPADIAQVRSGYQSAFADINNSSGSYTLSTANALWVQNNYQLLGSYASAIKTYYGGSITNLDFINDPSVAVSTINKWVADKTADKIQNILSSGDVNALTRLILTNAIYFKGAWSDAFDKSATQEKDFTTGNSDHPQVPMMEQTSNFAYVDTGNAQMLQLPYRGNDVSMFILLPKDNNLSDLDSSLDYQKINNWEKELQDHLVDVSLPKFKIETEERMPPDLKAMGMPTAFSPTDADFSGIAPIKDSSQNLYVSDVIHKAFIDTDENGTEAAAATAVVMVEGAMEEPSLPKPIIFNANHPFILFIQEQQTGNILFFGRVANP